MQYTPTDTCHGCEYLLSTGEARRRAVCSGHGLSDATYSPAGGLDLRDSEDHRSCTGHCSRATRTTPPTRCRALFGGMRRPATSPARSCRAAASIAPPIMNSNLGGCLRQSRVAYSFCNLYLKVYSHSDRTRRLSAARGPKCPPEPPQSRRQTQSLPRSITCGTGVYRGAPANCDHHGVGGAVATSEYAAGPGTGRMPNTVHLRGKRASSCGRMAGTGPAAAG